jgi:hypothetical protein
VKLDADEIAPHLWQGSLPPTGSAVSQAGFDLLVLCAREHQLPSVYFHDVTVINAPNDDHVSFGPLTREKLRVALQAARQVAAVVKAGQNALVTCAAGMNRSGLVSALALHLLYGWPGDQCIEQVRAKRGPRNGYQPLSNSDFTVALRRLPARGQPSGHYGARPGPG